MINYYIKFNNLSLFKFNNIDYYNVFIIKFI